MHIYTINLNAVYKNLKSYHRGITDDQIFTLLGTLRPRTTSERRISGVVSPGTLTTAPGKGGKLEAARSKFGGGATFASIRGIGFCNFYDNQNEMSNNVQLAIKLLH